MRSNMAIESLQGRRRRERINGGVDEFSNVVQFSALHGAAWQVRRSCTRVWRASSSTTTCGASTFLDWAWPPGTSASTTPGWLCLVITARAGGQPLLASASPTTLTGYNNSRLESDVSNGSRSLTTENMKQKLLHNPNLTTKQHATESMWLQLCVLRIQIHSYKVMSLHPHRFHYFPLSFSNSRMKLNDRPDPGVALISLSFFSLSFISILIFVCFKISRPSLPSFCLPLFAQSFPVFSCRFLSLSATMFGECTLRAFGQSDIWYIGNSKC